MKISIVVSIFNEENVIQLFYDELIQSIPNVFEYEIIFIDDGSTDSSQDIISNISIENKNVKSILFSRNFGHEAAMLAGIDYASGEAIICMDSDLQHPPVMIPIMLERFQEGGVDIINMVRSNNKSILSSAFYKLLKLISPFDIEADASDFFLISRRIAKILKKDYRERVRFLRGFIQMLGFKKTVLTFDVAERASGESKYSIFKLLSLSITAIATLSKFPLKLGTYLGFLSGTFGLIVATYSIIMKVIQHPVSGYTTIIVFLSIMFSIQFFILGVIGEYIGFLFDEQKKRPIYIIDTTTNFDQIHEISVG